MWLARSLGLFSNIHLLASENAWAWCPFIFFRERYMYPSKIRRGESITPTSACSPTASPLHLQYIRRPPSYLWSIVTQATSTVYEIRRHFYTFVYGPFKFPLCITVSDSGEYRKSSEINNGVNTLTPKIYKFSRLISEHFLEEIV